MSNVKTTSKTFAGWALAGLLLPAVLAAQDDPGKRLAAYMERQVGRHAFDLAVQVQRGDEVLLAVAYGWADVELQVPNTTATRFRIASMTKSLTAAAILRLEADGRLEVTDRLAKHLPEVPASWSEITLHHLLTQTSGLIHVWELPGWEERMMVPATLAEVTEQFRAAPLLFAPGEGYHYSGLGYVLLARVVEAVSGEAFDAYVRRVLLTPAGMEDTGADVPEMILPGRAAGYLRGTDGSYRNAPYLYTPKFVGSGNFYSTVVDMTRWLHGLEDVLPAESLRRMLTPNREGYGYGLRIRERFGRREVSHGGGLPGFHGFFAFYPEERLSVVVLGNNTFEDNPLSGKSHPVALVADLAAIVFGEPTEN